MKRILCVFLLLFFSYLSPSFAAETNSSLFTKPDLPLGFSIQSLNALYNKTVKTGVSRDAIPPISHPQFMSVSDASLSLDDDDIVFVVEYPNNIVRIYPQKILVWHEVVNDILPNEQGVVPRWGSLDAQKNAYSITYSPITGTLVAFRSLAGKYPSQFGTVGDLLNGNTLLYDAFSYSEWSQLLALCLHGPLQGKRLERIQVLWAKWRGVKKKYYTNAEVLSRTTGIQRPYGKDPYGSYQTAGSYYDNEQLVYPISYLDTRLAPKTHILGIEKENLLGAVQVKEVQQQLFLNFEFGTTALVALYDKDLETVRIFERKLDDNQGTLLTFAIFEDNFVDTETKSYWTAEGEATYGKHRGKRLTPFLSIDSMWFAWAAFHPESLIYPLTNVKQ